LVIKKPLIPDVARDKGLVICPTGFEPAAFGALFDPIN
jgi:hypothetical protein